MLRAIRWVMVLGWMGSFVLPARAQSLDPTNQKAREILKQLIEINTTDSVGNVTTAAEAMAQRLRAAGFTENDLHVDGPNDRKKNLVVRFRVPENANPSSSLAISMSSKPFAKTGAPTPSNSWNKTAISMDAAPRT